MRYVEIPGTPSIHPVPLPEIAVARSEIKLMLDGADEQRKLFIFQPYQAIRITTQDCFVVPLDSGFYKGGVFWVEESLWIAELKSALNQVDRLATFLDKSHHYVVPGGDDIVEIVAWRMNWSGSGGSGSYPR